MTIRGKSIVTAVPLRNASIAYGSPEFAADQVFKMVDMNMPTAKITKYLPGPWFRDDAKLRGEGGEATRTRWKTTEVTYNCLETAHAVPVTDELRRNAKKMNAQPLTPDTDAIELAKRKIMMAREREVAELVLGATWADGTGAGGADAEGNWASTVTGASNTFKADIKAALRALREKGIASNPEVEIRLLLDDLTFDEVVEIDAIKEQIKYTSAENVDEALLARFLKVDKVIKVDAIKNTAKETKAETTFTTGRFWEVNSTKGMAFLYAYPRRIKPKMMCSGLIIRDRFDDEEGGGFERVSYWRENANHQDVYEVAENRDQIQICADAGYMFKDTISD
jgi:hypothetical protein